MKYLRRIRDAWLVLTGKSIAVPSRFEDFMRHTRLYTAGSDNQSVPLIEVRKPGQWESGA